VTLYKYGCLFVGSFTLTCVDTPAE